MTTHVFIVDSNTFKFHLEYLFAGTGAKDNSIDFNDCPNPTTPPHPTTENNLVHMIADADRVRSGDQIIFYLQQDYGKKIFEGKFFGIFEAKDNWSFLDNNDPNQYLKTELQKSLTFRTLVTPHSVYPEGVTEWEALDEIKNINSPNQMLWSLIYRKLKGNRGNTMITVYEAERLSQLIRNKNGRASLNFSDKVLSFDPTTQKIVSLDKRVNSYQGRKEKINLLPRLIYKYQQGKSFEAHLQAYITKNIGLGLNPSLDETVIGRGYTIEWLGNEVSCGVGMQRIDVMTSVVKNRQKVLIPIELKAVEANERNVIQIQRYVDWIRQYYIPNRASDIQPVLLTKEINNKETDAYRRLVTKLNQFNTGNREDCKPLKFVEFSLVNRDLHFNLVNY